MRPGAAVVAAWLGLWIVGARADPASLEAYMALSGPPPEAIFRYGGAPSQKVELFLPEGRGPFPVVVLLHGGCWNSGYQGLTQLHALAAAFASQRIAVWNVEYRRIDEAGGGYPGTYRDVDAALDLLAKTAPDVGIDTSRVVAVGHSAGAQLALWAAARARIPAASPLAVTNPLPIAAVVALGGLLDLRRDADAIRDTCGLDVAALTGTPDASRPDVYADTSPAAMSPTGIATVAINGAEDGVAPPELARRYAARATRTGDRVRVIVVPDAGHFDEVMPVPPVWPTLLATVRAALGMARD